MTTAPTKVVGTVLTQGLVHGFFAKQMGIQKHSRHNFGEDIEQSCRFLKGFGKTVTSLSSCHSSKS